VLAKRSDDRCGVFAGGCADGQLSILALLRDGECEVLVASDSVIVRLRCFRDEVWPGSGSHLVAGVGYCFFVSGATT